MTASVHKRRKLGWWGTEMRATVGAVDAIDWFGRRSVSMGGHAWKRGESDLGARAGAEVMRSLHGVHLNTVIAFVLTT